MPKAADNNFTLAMQVVIEALQARIAELEARPRPSTGFRKLKFGSSFQFDGSHDETCSICVRMTGYLWSWLGRWRPASPRLLYTRGTRLARVFGSTDGGGYGSACGYGSSDGAGSADGYGWRRPEPRDVPQQDQGGDLDY